MPDFFVQLPESLLKGADFFDDFFGLRGGLAGELSLRGLDQIGEGLRARLELGACLVR